MAVERVINIKVNTSNAGKGLEEINKGVKDVDNSTSQLTGTLDKMTGGAITKFKSFTNALGGVATGFKGVGAAIAASGIGLLVITIASITAAFKNSEAGQNKFAKLMGVIGSVVGNVIDVLADLGDFIIDLFSGNGQAMSQLKSFGKAIFDVVGLPIKNVIDTVKTLGKVMGALFSGDVSKAFDELNNGISTIKGNFTEAGDAIKGAAGALKEFGQEALREAKIAAYIANQRANADKIERDLIVERAEANRKIAELRDKAARRDLFNAAERKAALLEASEINETIAAKEIEAAKIRRDALIEENKLSGSTKDDLKAEEEAKARVIELETAKLELQKRLGTEISSLNSAEQSLDDARIQRANDRIEKDAAAELKRLEDIQKVKDEFTKKNEELEAETLEAKLELERTRAEEALERLLGDETEKREALLELNAYYDQLEEDLKEQRSEEEKEKEAKKFEEFSKNLDKQLADEADAAEKEKALAENVKNAKIQIGTQTLNILGGLAKEGSDLAKGIAAAQATINTFQGVTAALSATSVIPDPFGSILKFANAAAVGVAGFINVKKILATKPVESSAPAAGGSGIPAPPTAPSFNLVEGSGSNQIAEGIAGQSNQPLQAYVVSSEVSTAQSLDRNIVDNSGF